MLVYVFEMCSFVFHMFYVVLCVFVCVYMFEICFSVFTCAVYLLFMVAYACIRV